MAQAGDEGVGAAAGGENGAAAQPMVAIAAARTRAAPGVATAAQAVANAAPAVVAVPAAPVVGRAAVVLAGAPVAAMWAGPVILNLAAPPRFDVETVLMGPLPRKSTMTRCEILPRVEEEEP